MQNNFTSLTGVAKPKRRSYQAPTIQVLGSVKKLTLKLGSNVDGMGGFA